MIETVPGESIGRLQKLARQYRLDVVPGTLMERDSKDGNVYNTAYYIDQSGDILLSYRKVHLWHSERTYITKGEGEFKVVKNRFGINVGLCICWDMAFPEVFRELSLKHNAQLIIIPGIGVNIFSTRNHFIVKSSFVLSVLDVACWSPLGSCWRQIIGSQVFGRHECAALL